MCCRFLGATSELKMKQKTKTSIIDRIDHVKLRAPGSVLVFESTGFALYSMVAQSGLGGSIHYSEPAMSTAPDMALAVGEVLAQLSERNKGRLPKKVVLITASASSDLLQLPINPQSPPPRAQMSELVRWELEESFEQQGDIWSLAALLQGRGYITAEQRQQLESADRTDRTRGSNSSDYRNLVSREQLEESLTLQELLTDIDEELTIGWSAQSSTDNEDDEDGAQFNWYCGGTYNGLRSKWVRAFKKHGLFCSGIYPLLGAGYPLTGHGSESRLLVDIRQEQFALLQGKADALKTLSIQACDSGTANPETVAAAAAKIIQPETRVVYVSATIDQLGSISAALREAIPQADIRPLPSDAPNAATQCPQPTLASLQGVAQHALKQCAPSMLVRIEGQAPRPPLWKNKQLWPWAIIALLLIGIATTEISMRIQTRHNLADLAQLEIEYKNQLSIKNQVLSTRREFLELKKTLTETQQEIRKKTAHIHMLKSVVLQRQELVPGLLQAIGAATPINVFIDRLEENDDRSGFNIEGWANRDTEGQLFGNQLNEELAPWHYKVGDIRLSRSNRQGSEGFTLKVQLVKIETEKEAKDD
jgi:hypothetical protein